MKDKALLLGAKGIQRNESEGKKALDFCLVEMAMKNAEGVFESTEFFYGKASQAKGLNAIVSAAGMPVMCEVDFSTQKDFATGKLTLVLDNLVVLKQ